MKNEKLAVIDQSMGILMAIRSSNPPVGFFFEGNQLILGLCRVSEEAMTHTYLKTQR